jgi:hypothetical protein
VIGFGLGVGKKLDYFSGMSTVQEIESAIEQLPLDKKYEIHQWLEEKFGPAHPPEGYFADDYDAMAKDEERMKLEESSLKVPQSPDR